MRDFTKKYMLTSLDDIKIVTDGVIDALGAGFNISEQKKYEISLVVNELLVNCFKHANPAVMGPVVFDASSHGGQLDIRVTDSGAGFAYRRHVDDLEENKGDMRLLSEHGRGLILVEAFCQKMIFSGRGNSVQVTIAL
jgi:anti-sigma regulatory factor (Ser/Thr protein kinase)